MKPKEHFHGSDLEEIEQVYGIKKEKIVSFSANVNPLGVSFRLRELSVLVVGVVLTVVEAALPLLPVRQRWGCC